MPDSLLFDGTDDGITCAVGGTAGYGPGGCGAVFKIGTSAVNRRCLSFNGTGTTGFYIDEDEVLTMWTGAGEIQGQTLSEGVWYCLVITKASGSATPRYHLYNYNSTTWSHQDAGGSMANSSAATAVHIGHEGGANNWIGNILIAASWSTDLGNDAAVEALDLESGLQAWVDSGPVEGWRLDTMSAIQSFGTTGTADETSRTGTSLDTGDAPSGWVDVAGAPQRFMWMP